MDRRAVLVAVGIILLVGATFTAYAQGAFLFRNADHRFEAKLDTRGIRDVERTWRFEIPQGVQQIEIRRHASNEGEARLSFGTDSRALHSVTAITPNPWRLPDLLGRTGSTTMAAAPGPFEIQVAADAPAHFVIGVYFHSEAYRP